MNILHLKLLKVLLLMFALLAGLVPLEDGLTGNGAMGSAASAPVPVTLPSDDGSHDASIEWWYYIGHLYAQTGQRFGFQYVVFKGESAGLPGYVAHFSVTDGTNGEFSYEQRRVLANPDAPLTAGLSFDLPVGDWRMSGGDGNDYLVASLDGYAIDLELNELKPPVLQDGDGYLDYGNGEGSYYYSRTLLDVHGSITIKGEALPVRGNAWFDHQWGDFQTVVEGGWDWFGIQMQDGIDVMFAIIRDDQGGPRVAYGSIVDPDGALHVLQNGDFTVTPTGEWRSAATGITYPSGWSVSVPSFSIELAVSPVLLNQELDARDTIGAVYWEGEVTVEGTVDGVRLTGLGYVELTGYGSEAMSS